MGRCDAGAAPPVTGGRGETRETPARAVLSRCDVRQGETPERPVKPASDARGETGETPVAGLRTGDLSLRRREGDAHAQGDTPRHPERSEGSCGRRCRTERCMTYRAQANPARAHRPPAGSFAALRMTARRHDSFCGRRAGIGSGPKAGRLAAPGGRKGTGTGMAGGLRSMLCKVDLFTITYWKYQPGITSGSFPVPLVREAVSPLSARARGGYRIHTSSRQGLSPPTIVGGGGRRPEGEPTWSM
jgi:hypothetical protein